MKIKTTLRSAARIVSAAVLGVAVLAPGFFAATAYAGQLESRSITLSTSAANASGVNYQVAFTTTNATDAQSIVIDFCSESPIISSTCTTPTAFSASSATLVSSVGNELNNWSITGSGGNIKLLKNTGSNLTTGTVSFVLGAIHNPSTVGTFYARAYTYASATAASYTDAETIGTTLDEGGFALSTANTVSVSGTVAESLTFCVADASITDVANCGSAVAPALVLGSGTPIPTLGATASTANAYSVISTNAGSGASIRMRNSNACAGLSKDGGTNCEIGPITSSGSTTPAALSSGLGKFGMKASTGDGDLTIASSYANATNYGMEWVTGNATGVGSTYGSTVASSTTVLDNADTTYTFAANAANTTPAGVYTATMTLIATGTY